MNKDNPTLQSMRRGDEKWHLTVPLCMCVWECDLIHTKMMWVWHFRACAEVMWSDTVGTIDTGTNPSEPTSECGLGNRENPSEPITPLPSPQYGKAEATEVSNTFCWLNFSDFSSGATRYDSLNFSDFSSGASRYGKSEKLSQQNV